jgi:hypothetical protein
MAADCRYNVRIRDYIEIRIDHNLFALQVHGYFFDSV